MLKDLIYKEEQKLFEPKQKSPAPLKLSALMLQNVPKTNILGIDGDQDDLSDNMSVWSQGSKSSNASIASLHSMNMAKKEPLNNVAVK